MLFRNTNLPFALFQRPAGADVDAVNPIRETFRKVTLDQQGARSIAGAVVSDSRSTPSSGNTSSGETNLIEFDVPFDYGGSGNTNSSYPVQVASPRSIQVDDSAGNESIVARSTALLNLAHFDDLGKEYPQFRDASILSQWNQPRLDSPSPPPMEDNGRVHSDVDKPEWEHASTIAEVGDGSADSRYEAAHESENLIEF